MALAGHLAAATEGLAAGPGEPLRVHVSIAPQAELVDRLAGGRARVVVLLPANASEETFSPSPRQLVELGQARLFVRVGHPALVFESRLVAPFLATHPAVVVADLIDGLELLTLDEAHHHHHHPGASPSAADDGLDSTDPHVWLSPANLRIAARRLAGHLERLDPDGAATYRANLESLDRDLAALAARLATQLAPYRGRAFLAAHASWGYFAHDFGLVQIPIDAGGREPGAARLVELARTARARGIDLIVSQPGFSRRSAQALAEATGATLVELDPLARDVIGTLDRLGDALATAFAATAATPTPTPAAAPTPTAGATAAETAPAVSTPPLHD